MEYNIDKLAADMENESPESQEEANKLIIEAVKKMSPEDRKTFVYDGIKVMEKGRSDNALLPAEDLKKHFVR
tara:strand:- start:397 stop:612 length:216 start_codon:yes stop_codon:yes gene_type:complete